MLSSEAKPSRPLAACSRCSTPAPFEAWGHPLCEGCWGAWLRDEQFTSGAINRHLGQSNAPEEFTREGHARYCAEATKRTAAWVREGAKRRGAA